MTRMLLNTGRATTPARYRRMAAAILGAVVLAAGGIQADGRPAGLVTRAVAQDDLPSDTNEAANALFVHALQEIADARRAGDAAARLALLMGAQASLDRILQDYPGSDLAVRLITGQRIGTFDPMGLQRDIRSAERAVAREARAAEREAARQAEEAAIEAERRPMLAAAEAEREAFCPEHPDPCALLADAMATVERMPEGIERVGALSQVASVHATGGLAEVANLAFADALRQAGEIRDDGWRANALWGISIGQAEGGLIAEALATAMEIHEDRSRALAYSSVASVLAEGGRLDEARATFAEAVATVPGGPDDSDDGQRWAQDLADIAFNQANAGFVEEARATLARLDGYDVLAASGRHGMQLRTSAEIGLAEARAGLVDEARQTFADTLTAAFASDDELSGEFALSNIVYAQVSAGFFEDTLTWVADVADEDLRARLISSVASRQAHAGQFDEALAAAATIPNEGERADTLRTIASAQANADLLAAALETIAAADAMAAGGDGDISSGRIWALTRIARAEAAAGRIDDARQRFADATAAADRIDDNFSPGFAHAYIAGAQAEAAASVLEAE